MERFDLYTADGQKTGQTMIRGTRVPEGLFHLVVHIWIQNGKGQYLIQKRTLQVDSWKGLWFTTGGSVRAGEDSPETVEREVREELGLELDRDSGHYVMRVLRDNEYLTDVYYFQAEVDLSQLKLQESEVEAVRWATVGEIAGMMGEAVFAKLNYFPEFLAKIEKETE